MDPKPSLSPDQQPQANADDYVEVEFRPDALVKFRECFADFERSRVLDLLVEQAEKGVEVARYEGFPVRLLTLFRIRFRYVDILDLDKLTILSLENGNNDSPPPNHKNWRDPLVSGGVAGLVRWLLGQIVQRAAPPGVRVGKAGARIIHLIQRDSTHPSAIQH